MISSEVSKYIVADESTIIEAMDKIDKNAKGILFIVDGNGRLKGCATDGDIRRWILKTGDLNANIENAMTKSPKALSVLERNRAASLMKSENIKAIPLINDNYEIVEIVFIAEDNEIRSTDILEGVPVVIMAGGKGTRLYPYTKILPKPLIPIGDTPIVERIMEYYTKFGIDKFYMTVNYKKEMIRSYFSENELNYSIDYVEENKPLGTGGSIKLIKDKFIEPLFVANCDTLILADYTDIYKYHVESGNLITIVAALKNVTVKYGVLQSGKNGEVMGLQEKPTISNLVNTGMYIINPEVIDLIPEDTFYHMTDLVDAVMNKGGRIGMYPISEDSFLDMGELSEMKRMEEKLNIAD